MKRADAVKLLRRGLTITELQALVPGWVITFHLVPREKPKEKAAEDGGIGG